MSDEDRNDPDRLREMFNADIILTPPATPTGYYVPRQRAWGGGAGTNRWIEWLPERRKSPRAPDASAWDEAGRERYRALLERYAEADKLQETMRLKMAQDFDTHAGFVLQEKADVHEPAASLTVRDHFAGLAMQELLRNDLKQKPTEKAIGPELVAKYAYVVADAMLKERKANG